MFLGDRGSRSRCLFVWASGTSALAVVLALALPCAGRLWTAGPGLRETPLDRALVEVAASVVVGCAAWGWLGLSATVAEAWRGAGPDRRGPWHLPAGGRRVVLAACGVALASTAVGAAHADDAGSLRHPHGVARLSGLPLPDRAVAPARRHPRAPDDGLRTVVVRPGDSLWSIARRDLGPAASDHAVASCWHAIYAANRSRIGPDPDLVRPGQRLHLPRKDRS